MAVIAPGVPADVVGVQVGVDHHVLVPGLNVEPAPSGS
jgi:hypothetical protein